MGKKDPGEVSCYGVRVYRTRHQAIRRLKKEHLPSVYGNRVWTSSWLLMNFLRQQGMPSGLRVMDAGCGWGLAGIYCARNHASAVTSVDRDSEVFPFLRLHADLNNVQVTAMNQDFNQITDGQLAEVDLLIGSDICFWDNMVDPLGLLMNRALDCGVRMVLIADPGRPTFDRLGESFIRDRDASVVRWQVQRPYPITGYILKIGALRRNQGPDLPGGC